MRAEDRKRGIQEGIKEAQRGGLHFIQDVKDEFMYGPEFLKEKWAVREAYEEAQKKTGPFRKMMSDTYDDLAQGARYVREKQAFRDAFESSALYRRAKSGPSFMQLVLGTTMLVIAFVAILQSCLVAPN